MKPIPQKRVEETLARLGELYRRHGYYRTLIQPRFELHHQTARLSLTFQIEAGDQELVNQLDLRVEGDLNEEQILSLAKTREGKPFSRVQLEEDLKAIEDHLIWQGYLRCSVKETIRYSDDEHGVSVAVFIATREHTQIEFQGIEVKREELALLPHLQPKRNSTVLPGGNSKGTSSEISRRRGTSWPRWNTKPQGPDGSPARS